MYRNRSELVLAHHCGTNLSKIQYPSPILVYAITTGMSFSTLVLNNCVSSLSFSEYELQASNTLKLPYAERVLSIGRIADHGDHNQRRLAILTIDKDRIWLRTCCSGTTFSAALPLGSARVIKGCTSVDVIDGPAAVIVYNDRVCIHSMSSEAAFSQPLEISYKPDIGNILCMPFPHAVWDASTNQYRSFLFLRFYRNRLDEGARCDSSCSTEWLVLDTANLSTILTPGSGDGSLSGQDGAVPAHQQQHQLFQYAMGSGYKLQGAIQADFPGMNSSSGSVPPNGDVINVAYATVLGRCSNAGRVAGRRTRTQALMTLLLLSTGELSCAESGCFKYKRTILIADVSKCDYLHDVRMQVVESSVSPLLLLSHRHSLLLLDIRNNGAVLREFCNVGAYICTPLFHALECHLLVVPTSEQQRIRLRFVENGNICNVGAAALPHVLSEEEENSPTLTNYFVYELPACAAVPTSAENSDAPQSPPLCRSMDPHGLWREDAKLSVDAEAYNSVRWRRVPLERNVPYSMPPQSDSTSTSNYTSYTSIVGKKRGHPSNVPAQDSFANAPSSTSNAATTATNRCTISSAAEGAGGSNVLDSLRAHLALLQQEVRAHSATMRYKQAAADHVRSVLINQAASTTANAAGGCANSLSISNIAAGCIIAEPTAPESATNPYLHRLRAIEAEYLVPITAAGRPDAVAAAAHMTLAGGDHADGSANIVVNQVSPRCALIVRSLNYIPVPGTHAIELYLVVTNTHPQEPVNNIFLSAYFDDTRTAQMRAAAVNVSCVSAIVDVLRAGETCCVKALVRLPTNAFVALQSSELVMHVCVHWSERAISSASTVPATNSNDHHQDRLMSLHAGVVHLHMSDLHTMPAVDKNTTTTATTNATATTSIHGISLCWSGIRSAERGFPCLAANSFASHGHHGSDYVPSNIAVYQYLPCVHLTLSSPLLSQLRAVRALNPYNVTPRQVADELGAFLRTAQASSFAMGGIRNRLIAQLAQQRWSQWGQSSTCVLAVHGASSSGTRVGRMDASPVVLHLPDARTNDSSGTNTENMSSKELFALASNAVTMSAQLRAAHGITDEGAALGSALLHLRQLLPSEVRVDASTGSAQAVVAATRQAAACLLEELKLTAVAHRTQAERRAGNQDDTQLVRLARNLEVPLSMACRILRARMATDEFIAQLFSL